MKFRDRTASITLGPAAQQTPFLRDFLRVWLPTVALASLLLLIVYQQEEKHQIQAIEVRHQAQIDEAFAILRNRLAASVRDIRHLTSTQDLEAYVQAHLQHQANEPQLRARLAEGWRRFMATCPNLYDQIRYLDRDGREIIRINKRDNASVIVPSEELQQKFDRYYVREARELPGDTIYLSRLDLNIERGVVEYPIKPMLRLVTPPLAGRLNDGGMVVLNFLTQPILERLRGATDRNPLWMLDAQGYWLLGDTPDQEWGFVLSERKSQQLGIVHPALQAELDASPPSETLVHRTVGGGVFSYARYNPSAYTAALLPGVKLHDGPNSYWTLARWTPAEQFAEQMQPYLVRLWTMWGLVVVLISLGSGHTAWANQRRARALAAQHAATVTLERFIECAPDAIIVSDRRGVICISNTQAEKWLGYEPGELIGLSIETLVPGRARNQHPDLRQGYLDQPVSRAMGEVRSLTVQRKDGSELPVSISLNALGSGDDLRVISALRDISAQQEGESALRAASHAALQASRQLAESNRELESFAYSVSHDLRAPLRSLDGFSNILLKSYADKIDDDGRDFLQRIRAASQRMGQMIDDILKLSRIGREEIRREPVNLSAIAEAVISQLREGTPNRAVDCEIATGLTAHADPALVRVALENLIGNAWKYTGKLDQARIDFGQEIIEGETVFFLRDNGAGFDGDHAEKLFGAFQRLHHASDFPGNGIGLATVMRVIRKHGGRIWAESQIGAGATFRFTFGEDTGDNHG